MGQKWPQDGKEEDREQKKEYLLYDDYLMTTMTTQNRSWEFFLCLRNGGLGSDDKKTSLLIVLS